jgi:hypothetical protein
MTVMSDFWADSSLASIDARLEVGAVFDTVRRIYVNHPDLSCHHFLFKKGIHYQKTGWIIAM